MSNQWLRLWHDMPTDPKWQTIARISKQPITSVLSIYLHLMVDASRNVTRGHAGIEPEDLASVLCLEEENVTAILAAMQGRVLDGMRLLGWENRQPKKEDGAAVNSEVKSAAQRKAEQRAREKAARDMAKKHDEVTQCHDESRNVTLDKIREEENITTTSSSDDDVRKCPIGSIVNLYHECMPANPQVRVLNEARKGAIRQRWKEAAEMACSPFGYKTRDEGLAAWRTFFEICAESDFLTGRAQAQPGKPPFVADIDFLFSPSAFAKILENKYHRETA